MSVHPELKSGFDRYEITEKAGLLSGDRVKFGDYLATDVDHDWTRGSSTTVSSYKNQQKRQRYRFNFRGRDQWKGECQSTSKEQSVGRVAFGLEEGIECDFVVSAGAGAAPERFAVTVKGPWLVDIGGSFETADGMVTVTTVSTVEGSGLRMNIPTGYHFYNGDRLISSVDAINKTGPVWLASGLSAATRERIGLVIVALLTRQE